MKCASDLFGNFFFKNGLYHIFYINREVCFIQELLGQLPCKLATDPMITVITDNYFFLNTTF